MKYVVWEKSRKKYGSSIYCADICQPQFTYNEPQTASFCAGTVQQIRSRLYEIETDAKKQTGLNTATKIDIFFKF